MSTFDGSCNHCPFMFIGYCVALHVDRVSRPPDAQCADLDKRREFIHSLVTSPEFVPEDVQEQVVREMTYENLHRILEDTR